MSDAQPAGKPTLPGQPVLVLLTSHWVSMAGVALVTLAGFAWLFVLPQSLNGHVSNPYIGLLAFVAIPSIFFAGLILVPIGIALGRRRIAHIIDTPEIRRFAVRRAGMFFVIMTLVNLVIASQASYRAVEHLDTDQFCGQTCHVMKPEFTAHMEAPHQQVACASCHIVPGAAGWFKAKLAGTRQLVAVAFNTFPRPVESPLDNNRLAPSAETCEQCHAREKYIGPRLRVITHFKDDEANTRTETVLTMLVGGGNAGGIHGAHMGPGVQIRYAAADTKRDNIPWIEYRATPNGAAQTYLAKDAKPESVSSLPVYDMQCVDCHNRAAHKFTSPENAVDQALAAGSIPSSLPFVKKTGLALIKASYSSQEEATQKIAAGLTSFYQQKFGDAWAAHAADVQLAAAALSGVYGENVFPDLKVTWGTYANNLGHMDDPGCFRCHDDGHATADKTAAKASIPQDCDTCHHALAMEESNPAILKTLGIDSAILHAPR
jgi:nitrate/TMAO reductase-like tetraheme cytochrome c subunit